MNLAALREATSADHAEVEGALPLMDPRLSLAEYVRVLARMRGVVATWEEYAAAAAPAWLQGALRERSRLALLDQDLRCLGAPAEAVARPVMPVLGGVAQMLGAMYVVEGSRLGGQLIARHIAEQFGMAEGCGTAYFRGYGERTGTMWKAFLGLMQEQIPDEGTEEVIHGAKTMFRVFGEWMRGADGA